MEEKLAQKLQKEAEKLAQKQQKEAEKLAQKEAKQAEKLAQKQQKEAEKLSQKQAEKLPQKNKEKSTKKSTKQTVKFTGALGTSIRKMYKDEIVAVNKAEKKKKHQIIMKKRQLQALELAAAMFRRADRRSRTGKMV